MTVYSSEGLRRRSDVDHVTITAQAKIGGHCLANWEDDGHFDVTFMP
jgi:hypothetical protein